jgi:paraquat-inducible protein B
MTEELDSPSQAPEALPEAVVAPRSRVSIVWLIPLVALIAGGWLAYKTYSEQGPTIAIEFKSASGLQAGKTKVKYKDVEVGQVTAIDLSKDLKGVVITAQLVAGAERYLTDKTRFWVARARVSASRVSGLDTLLSGAYIAIDPVTEGKATRHFVGLEDAPLFTASEPGKTFVLRAESVGSLNVGSPVYYRYIQAGQVVDYELDEDGQAVSIEVFIGAPYDRLVLTTTRFWNASGIDLTLSAEGVRLDTQSLLSVIIGGVAFDTPSSIEKGTEAPNDQRFPLYENAEAAHAKTYLEKRRYLLFFTGSVRGLEVGAPVLLRGLEIGRVLDVQLEFDTDAFEFRIPVLVEIEPERIGVAGRTDGMSHAGVLSRLVEEGLRAELKTGSLLTGKLYVDLELHPEAPKAALTTYGDYQVVPTLSSAPLEEITAKVNALLDKLDRLPIAEIGNDLRDTVKGASTVVNAPELTRALAELEKTLKAVGEASAAVDAKVIPQLNANLAQLDRTLVSVQGLVNQDSPLFAELQRTLKELSAAARSIRAMADYLERHPEALIKGKGNL